ncbi:MAG: response regulator [Planctomycetes bacterium]|nr:response regulator [Planctomycetota bacterium]
MGDDMVDLMVVEDESIVAKDIQSSLESMGYSTSCVASTGEEAILLAARHRPDLVLMDIRLPGRIDGIEAAQEISSRYEVPVIFLTAFADEELIRRACEVGGYGYLMKPFQEREVYASIEMAIAKHRQEQQREARLRQLEGEALPQAAPSDIIPVCAKCKKVRTDEGKWEQFEAFFRSRFGAQFTHWLCPNCYDEEMEKLQEWDENPP